MCLRGGGRGMSLVAMGLKPEVVAGQRSATFSWRREDIDHLGAWTTARTGAQSLRLCKTRRASNEWFALSHPC